MQKLKPVNPVKFYLLGGIPFYILLTLKLTGVVAWSWWWITLPIWLPIILLTFLAVAFCAFMLWPTTNKVNIERKVKSDTKH